MNVDILDLAKVLKVLGDVNRFRILRLLLEFDLCVDALAERLDISKSGVSQHLKRLREAGLVRGEKRGYFTHYVVERERLRELGAGLSGLAEIPKSRCSASMDCGGPIKKKME